MLRRDVKTVDITATVPVHSLLSGYLATPGVGVGIYDHEGVVKGQPYTRTYTLTRTSGPKQPVVYDVSWAGNDGTFSAPATVTLPRGTAVSFDVRIDPAAYGDHAAILRLDDPATVGFDLQTMNMVAVPYEFNADDSYQATVTGTVGRNQALHYFFRIPDGTTTFKVDFTGPSADPGTGQARFLRWNPYGMPVDSNASANCYSPPTTSGCAEGSPNSRTLTNPMPGVWEVTVDTRRTSDVDFAPFTLTASALKVAVAPGEDVIDPATVGGTYDRSYTVTNSFGGFTGRAAGSTLGSAYQGVFTTATGQQQQYPLTVTPGTTRLTATIGGTSDPAADLDLFVYDCTSGTCVQAGTSAGGGSDEAVTIANPAAGAWIVLVDGYAVPSGSTTYNYLDVFTNPAFGAVGVTDTNAPRDSGATWTVPGTVTVGAVPGAGRVLVGGVNVYTDTNALLASARVVVRNVS